MNTMGLIDKCIKSLSTNAPTVETVLMLKADDAFWKEFVSKPGNIGLFLTVVSSEKRYEIVPQKF